MTALNDHIVPSSAELNTHQAIAEDVGIALAFQRRCCCLIICGYYESIKEGILKLDWEEEQFTEHLKKHMKICVKKVDDFEGIHVAIESPEDVKDIEDGLVSPKKRRFFDLMFSTFEAKDEYYFGVEAKILIENNTNKRNASTEMNEYLSDKGMGKYINRIYENTGCMVGYIIQGDINEIVEKLNIKISDHTSYSKSEILTKEGIFSYEHFYSSDHAPRYVPAIKHIMLDLQLTGAPEQDI